MLDFDQWHEIFSVLKKNKTRTALTAFGVFWGIFLLIILLGSGTGLRNGTERNFGDLATNSVFIWPERTTIAYKGFPKGRGFWFTNEDLISLKGSIPELEAISPMLHGWGGDGDNNASRGAKTGSFTVEGHSPEMMKISPCRVLEGRFLNELDVSRNRKVALIGTRVRDILFEPGENPAGEYIRLKGVYFKVIGVIEPLTMRENDVRELEKIVLPYTTLQKIYGYGNVVGTIVMTSVKNVPASVVEEKAKKLLAARLSISPEDDRAIGGFNLENEYMKIQKLFISISVLVWIIGAGTLVSGVIGVSNIMLITVKERTKEFGIKRAIGATPLNIITQVILESVSLTALTGFLGIAAGVWALEGISSLIAGMNTGMFKNPGVDLSVTLKALSVLIIFGTLAGLIPARGAVSVKPIDAIRK